MLPLTTKDKHSKRKWRLGQRISGWLRLIFSDANSRNLFMFLCLNLSMAFVEFVYGAWTNSLGLISDSFHMFFDCTALLAGLAASMIAKWRRTDTYTYGYVRIEVIAGFVNSLFLVFIAFFISSESVERIFEPPEVKHDRLFLVSVLGFIVNLIGIFAFHGHGHSHGGVGHGHSHGGGGHGHSHSGGDHNGHSHGGGGHGHSHNNHSHFHGDDDNHRHSHGDDKKMRGSQSQIFQGVFLHIMADTLGSVGVIISSALIEWYGWMMADPICSLCIAILIIISVIPLLRDSLGVLLQRQPRELDASLPGAYTQVSQLEGVYSVQEAQFWTLCSEVYIGGVKLEVAHDADIKYIQKQAHNIFTAVGIRQLYVQVDFSAM